MKRLVIVFLCLLLAGCSAKVKDPWLLTDDQIKEAIAYGKECYETNNLTVFHPWEVKTKNGTASVTSEYILIVTNAYIAAGKYQTVDFDVERKQADACSRLKFPIYFSVDVFGDKIDFCQTYSAVLKVGDTVIQPEKSKVPLIADDVVSLTKYKATLEFGFPRNQVPRTGIVQLVVIPGAAKLQEMTWDFDMSKIK